MLCARLFHFVVISSPFMFTLEMFQIIVNFLIKLVKVSVLQLQTLSFPRSLLCMIQLHGQILMLILNFNSFPLTITNSFSQFFKVCCTIINFRLHVYNWLLVSHKFCLTSSHSTLKFVSPSKSPDQVIALSIACKKKY